MRCLVKESLLSAALVLALSSMGHPQAPAPTPAATPEEMLMGTRTLRAVSNCVTVTDQIVRSPEPEDWLIYRGNYQAWAYSPLDRINKTNVQNLQLVWARAMEPGVNQATPLVYNGVMYLGNPNDVIQAIDAATGDLLWEYRHPIPPARLSPARSGHPASGASRSMATTSTP